MVWPNHSREGQCYPRETLKKTKKVVYALPTIKGVISMEAKTIKWEPDKKKVPVEWFDDAGTWIRSMGGELPNCTKNLARKWISPKGWDKRYKSKVQYGKVQMFVLYIKSKRKDSSGERIKMCYNYFIQAWDMFAWEVSPIKQTERQFCFCTFELHGHDYLQQMSNKRKQWHPQLVGTDEWPTIWNKWDPKDWLERMVCQEDRRFPGGWVPNPECCFSHKGKVCEECGFKNRYTRPIELSDAFRSELDTFWIYKSTEDEDTGRKSIQKIIAANKDGRDWTRGDTLDWMGDWFKKYSWHEFKNRYAMAESSTCCVTFIFCGGVSGGSTAN